MKPVIPRFGGSFETPRLLLGLAVLTALPELVLVAADFGLIGTGYWRSLAYQNGAFWAGLLHNWRPNYIAQPYTMFITYAFLHSGMLHLVTNLVILQGLGTAVWRRSGNIGFLVQYFAAILGGALVFGLLSNSPRPMVGASGGLFGLVGVWLYLNLIERRAKGRPVWPVFGMIAGLVVLNALSWVLQSGTLAWETHLGGFIAGWASAMVVQRVRRD